MTIPRLFLGLVFWLLPQEIIRYPIEIYGFGRAVAWIGVLACVAVLLHRLGQVPAVAARWSDLRGRLPMRILIGIAKVGLLVPTLFYWIWFWAYTRVGVAVAATVAVTLAVIGLIRRWWYGPLAGLMTFAWIAFAVVMLVRYPPPPWTCPGPSKDPATRVVLSRAQIDRMPGLRWSNPFDVVRDPRDGRLFVSHQSAFWSTRRGGQVVEIRPDGSVGTASLPAESKCTLYPDHMALDAAGQRLFVVTSGNGVYCLARFDVSRGLVFDKMVTLAGEAHDVVYRGGRLYVLFWPAEADNLYHDVVVEVLDATDFHSIAKLRVDPDGRRVGQPALAPDGTTMWVPALEGGWLSISLDTLKLTDHPGQADFAFGGTLDSTGATAYSVSPITWKLVARDLASGKERAARTLEGTPWAIAFDPVSNRLVTLSFLAGRLDLIDPASLAPVGSAPVGRLARSLALDPASGNAWVASGCGVYQVELGPGGAPSAAAP